MIAKFAVAVYVYYNTGISNCGHKCEIKPDGEIERFSDISALGKVLNFQGKLFQDWIMVCWCVVAGASEDKERFSS